jgi:hypothetical protein
MITTEQVLHALTGGQSASVTRIAVRLVQHFRDVVRTSHDPTDCAALGFALHLLGDSFAHRQIDNQPVLYPTGKGHALDSIYPDLPLYERERGALYCNYLTVLACALSTASACDTQGVGDLSGILTTVQTYVEQHAQLTPHSNGFECLGSDCYLEDAIKQNALIPGIRSATSSAATGVIAFITPPTLDAIDTGADCQSVATQMAMMIVKDRSFVPGLRRSLGAISGQRDPSIHR